MLFFFFFFFFYNTLYSPGEIPHSESVVDSRSRCTITLVNLTPNGYILPMRNPKTLLQSAFEYTLDYMFHHGRPTPLHLLSRRYNRTASKIGVPLLTLLKSDPRFQCIYNPDRNAYNIAPRRPERDRILFLHYDNKSREEAGLPLRPITDVPDDYLPP